VLDESGDAKGAEAAATKFLEGRAALELNTGYADNGITAETVPWLVPLAVRAGTLIEAKGDEQLATWRSAWRVRAKDWQAYPWPDGMAVSARVLGTEEAGRKAVGSFDPSHPMPAYFQISLGEANAGVAHFLGGKVDEALPWLERAAKKCSMLDHPVEQTRAFYYLGRAREQKGDAKEACAAYGVVLTRWGRANPSSVTAEKARPRVAGLGCR
jgi:tetratricopeptide (TPR) repeat protein